MLLGCQMLPNPNLQSIIKKVKSDNANILQTFLTSKPFSVSKNSLFNIDFKEIKDLLKKNNLKLVIHSNYLLNFCSYPPSSKRIIWALEYYLNEMKKAHKLGALGTILHIGAKKDLSNKDAYYNSNSTIVGNSNGYHQGIRKPWEPKRTKQMASGVNNAVSPKQHTPVVAVSLDDSNDNGGQFAAVDIAEINVAWDGGSKDDIEVHDKIINRNKKHHSLGLKEDSIHRSKLDELAQVLETLRSSPTNTSNI